MINVYSLYTLLTTQNIQDVSTRLIAPGAFVATQPEESRSPSPEPIYDQKGFFLCMILVSNFTHKFIPNLKFVLT